VKRATKSEIRVKPEIRFNTEVTEDAEKTGLPARGEGAVGGIPGKYTKSAQGIEKERDGFRFGAKEGKRAR
jgi:hypothetical protein